MLSEPGYFPQIFYLNLVVVMLEQYQVFPLIRVNVCTSNWIINILYLPPMARVLLFRREFSLIMRT